MIRQIAEMPVGEIRARLEELANGRWTRLLSNIDQEQTQKPASGIAARSIHGERRKRRRMPGL